MRDGLADRTGNVFDRVNKGRLFAHAVFHDIPSVKRFHDTVDRAQENAAFAEDVTPELVAECGHEDVRRAHSDRPAQGMVDGAAVHVLLYGKA